MSADAPKQDLKELLGLLEDIPPMPAVATKVLEVAGSEDATLADVTRLIAGDQSLASKLLSTCNSAYYGLPQQVKTLSRAVALLGFKSVRNMVLVCCMPRKRGETPAFSEQMIWTHAAATAMAARVIAGQTGGNDPEEALLAGLMHDSGRLALNLLMPDKYEPVMRSIYNREGDSIAIEKTALGMDHATVGELVLRKWCFPDALARVAATHHDPPEQLHGLALTVRAADEISWLLGQGVREPDEPPTELPPGLTALGFTLDELESLEERISTAIEQGRKVFGLT